MKFDFLKIDVQANSYAKKNKQMFDLLLQVLKCNKPVHILRCAHRNHSQTLHVDVLQWIYDVTCDIMPLIDKYTDHQRIDWIVYDRQNFPLCEICHKPISNSSRFSIEHGYYETCCSECGKQLRVQRIAHTASAIPDFYAKRTQTMISNLKNKHGVVNVFQLPQIKRKCEQTKLERHGDPHYFDMQKSKETRLKRYGAYESEQSKQRRKSTFLKHYGVDNNMKSPVGRLEFTNAFYEKYEAHNPGQVPEIRRKAAAKYSYDNNRFDSAPEVAFYIWLKDNNKQFTYHPDEFLSYDFNGITYRYFPDFKVENQFVELKGDHLIDKTTGKWICIYDQTQNDKFEAKHQCAMRNNVKVMTSNEYAKYVEYVNETYGNKYINSFKQK